MRFFHQYFKQSYQWLVGWSLPYRTVVRLINDTTRLLASVKQFYCHNRRAWHVYLCFVINIYHLEVSVWVVNIIISSRCHWKLINKTRTQNMSLHNNVVCKQAYNFVLCCWLCYVFLCYDLLTSNNILS